MFANVLELEEHTPTGPIVMNICKPELTKVIPVDLNPNVLKLTRFFCQEIVATRSNAGVYVGTFLLLAVLVIGGVVLFFCLRFTSLTFCQMMPEFL